MLLHSHRWVVWHNSASAVRSEPTEQAPKTLKPSIVSPMKILKVIATLHPCDGGPFKTVPELARALINRGHEVDIYTTGTRTAKSGINSETLTGPNNAPTTYFAGNWPQAWKCSYALAEALSHNVRHYDIVHIYSLYLFHGVVASYFCRRDQVPYVIQPHGTLDPYLRLRHRWRKGMAQLLFENRNLRGAYGILFNSEEEHRLAVPFIRDTPSFVVPLGLFPEQYDNLPPLGRFRSRFPEFKNKQLLLYLGRLNFKKGLDILLQGYSQLLRMRKDVHLVIAGPDNEGYGAHLREWCRTLKVQDSVTLTGMLSEEDKRSAMVDAKLFVLMSYTENFGVSILESLACGTPVLISDRVNIWRQIAEARAGEVVSCKPEAISQMMNQMLNSPELLAQMKENGRRLVREQFDWASVARLQEETYLEVLRRRRTTAI